MNSTKMTNTGRPAWVEVDLGAISNNIDIIRDHLSPGCTLCAVVKADAYGHGLKTVANMLQKKGVDCFAVATVEEGIAVRTLTGDAMIIVLSLVWPGQIETVLDYGLVTGVSDPEYAKRLSEAARARGTRAKVFAMVDTGMSRIGFLSEDPDTPEMIRNIAGQEGLELLGLMSHFAGSNDVSPEGIAYTDMQEQRFAALREKVLAEGVPLKICSICNSFAAMTRPSAHYQLVRTGAVMFGSYVDTLKPRFGFMPAMSVKALVMHIKTVPAGTVVGYNRISRVSRPSVIGTLNLGYADGIPRNWSAGTGYVLVRGCRAPILGPLCMDQMMIDLTDVPGASLYDEAVLIGRDGDLEITADEMGEKTGSFFDTIVTAVSLRLPYVYLSGSGGRFPVVRGRD